MKLKYRKKSTKTGKHFRGGGGKNFSGWPEYIPLRNGEQKEAREEKHYFVNEELKNEKGEGRRSIAKENALNSLIVRTNHSDASLFALFVHIYARCI